MGTSKARMSIQGEPAVVRLVRIYREAALDPIVVVGAELADLVDDAIVVAGDEEMIGSLARGIEALPSGVEAAVVQPVDAPFTTAAAIEALCARTDRARVLAFEGTPGHPVLLPRTLFAAVRARPQGGLRTLLEDAELIPWDRSVLADLDTPADLVRWEVHE
jgi:CTP:molybdopterin cytidylyltransferase MocA